MTRVLRELRHVFYDILLAGEENDTSDNVSAIQKMGVGISKSVQKEGNVVIVQNQSVMLKKVAVLAVSGLQQIDRIAHDAHTEELQKAESPLLLPEPKEQSYDLHSVCSQLLDRGWGYQEFKEHIHKVYLESAVQDSGTQAEVALKLKMQLGNLKQCLGRHGVKFGIGGGEDARTT